MKIYESIWIEYHDETIKRNSLKEVDSIVELNKIVAEYQDNQSHRYVRVMPAINEIGAEYKNGIMIDYGSWSRFLYVDGITFNEYVKGDVNRNED